MDSHADLENRLARIDGRGYKAYKEITGSYQFPGFCLIIDHVQGDPFAAPSRMRARVGRTESGLVPGLTRNRSRRVALCDYLTRRFHQNGSRHSAGRRGTGKSGLIAIDRPGQEILETSAMAIDDTWVEARFVVGLPASGRRISGRDATAMLLEELPQIVRNSLFYDRLDPADLERHVNLSEDADALRRRLKTLGLVGFVGNGALLPRASGVDPLPLTGPDAVPFQTPPAFEQRIRLPHHGSVTGMGIPQGVTLIVGGGYHGKSTLLHALELGIYNHLPGDGRERVVSDPAAVKIRAADGRSIVRTDISPFIGPLPFAQGTRAFSTPNASGSTSQAASISEALEAGARVLLLDEDTSATNFMIRDRRMQLLVPKADEPITPFIDRVRQLFDERGVSTVLVMGGAGDYFSVAHQVIQMHAYRPRDVTRRALDIARSEDTGRLKEGGDTFGELERRIPLPQSIDAHLGNRRLKIAAPRKDEIRLGNSFVDIGDVAQIVHGSQTRAIAHAMLYARRYMDGRLTLREVVDRVMQAIETDGLDVLTPHVSGDLARFRGVELAAAVNRLRSLQVVPAQA